MPKSGRPDFGSSRAMTPGASTFILNSLPAFADMLTFDGNRRIDDLPSRHCALRYNRRGIVLRRIEGEIAGHVHVQLPGAPHAPPQRRGGGIEFDPFATGIYGPVFGRTGSRAAPRRLGARAARPELGGGLAA